MLAPRATLINIAAVIDQVLLGDAPLNNLREVKRAVGVIHDMLPPDQNINGDPLYLHYLLPSEQFAVEEARGRAQVSSSAEIDGRL